MTRSTYVAFLAVDPDENPLPIASLDDLTEEEAQGIATAAEKLQGLPDCARIWLERDDGGIEVASNRFAAEMFEKDAKASADPQTEVAYRLTDFLKKRARSVRARRVKATDVGDCDLPDVEHWGPADGTGCTSDGSVTWSIRSDLYRHYKQHWVLVNELYDYDGVIAPPNKYPLTLNDREAVDWLLTHGYTPPRDVAHLIPQIGSQPTSAPPMANAGSEDQDATAPLPHTLSSSTVRAKASVEEADTIPPDQRTKPMSFKDAANYMGKGRSKDAAEWVSNCVKDGTIRCESKSRVKHIFSKRDFPEGVWPSILPSALKEETDPNSP